MTGLRLDARHRAMLEEMGITVWAAEPARVAPTAEPSEPTEPVRSPTRAGPTATGGPAAAVSAPQIQSPGSGLQSPSAAGLDWSSLERAVAGCEACGLCRTRRQTVFGTGSRDARWMVVGEAPGENEDQQGEPFVGQAGKLLDNMLRALELDRNAQGDRAVFIANVLKCRPPANRNPQPEEVAQCEPYLRRQVALLQPRIILALGRFAAQSLLQGSVDDVASMPLGRLRGRVHRYEGVPVIVSYHPAYLLRTPQDKAKAWADLCLAYQVFQTGGEH